MNKQEVIEKIKNIKGLAVSDKTVDYREVMVPMGEVLNIIDQLDEPEKLVLTKEEAEWIDGLKELEEIRPFCTKIDLLYFITRCGFGYGFSYDRKGEEIELKNYPYTRKTEKERLINAILYGYKVKKEKLYTVELPNPNDHEGHMTLSKKPNGKIYLDYHFNDCWRIQEKSKLTEAEIKEDFEWAWQFAEEVEE